MSEKSLYPDFEFPSWFEGPADLVGLLRNIWNYRFPDLYDKADGREASGLDKPLNEILDKLWGDHDDIGHKRFVFAGLAMAIAAKPTLDTLMPGDTRPEMIVNKVESWLKELSTFDGENLLKTFPQQFTASQALDEAIDLFRNLIRVVNIRYARTALLEILDDCLEGFAIFSGSYRRRDILNWFLIEVVPAAWHLRLPEGILMKKL